MRATHTKSGIAQSRCLRTLSRIARCSHSDYKQERRRTRSQTPVDAPAFVAGLHCVRPVVDDEPAHVERYMKSDAGISQLAVVMEARNNGAFVNMLDALSKNSSLSYLNLGRSGITWTGANSEGLFLVEQMASVPSTLASLQRFVIRERGFEMPIKKLRVPAEALASLRQAKFFRQEGPRREEVLLLRAARLREGLPSSVQRMLPHASTAAAAGTPQGCVRAPPRERRGARRATAGWPCPQ